MKKLLLVSLLLISTLAYSQVEKGDFTTQASVTFQSMDGLEIGLIFAKAGYFFTDNIEAGSSLNVIFAAGETGTGIGPFATYNFLLPDGKMLPYAGVQFSLFSFGGLNINSGGLYGGAKYFLTEAVNVDGALSIQQGFGDFDGTIVSVTIGVGIILGKLK